MYFMMNKMSTSFTFSFIRGFSQCHGGLDIIGFVALLGGSKHFLPRLNSLASETTVRFEVQSRKESLLFY